MTTFNWTIEQLDVQINTGGVITAYWRVVAGDEGYVASSYGSVNFTPYPTEPDFIPFLNLTEQDVLTWVWTEVNKEELEDLLDKEIQAKKTPVVATGLPW